MNFIDLSAKHNNFESDQTQERIESVYRYQCDEAKCKITEIKACNWMCVERKK